MPTLFTEEGLSRTYTCTGVLTTVKSGNVPRNKAAGRNEDCVAIECVRDVQVFVFKCVYTFACVHT